MEEKKLKIALVGVGNIGDQHMKSYQAVPAAEVIALCDINEEKLKRKGELYGITRLYTDIDVMLAEMKDELDAVDVCVWNVNHASCAIKSLNAGLNVFCEKPMAFNADQAIQMKEAADKAGKLLMVGFVMRFMTNGKVAKELLDKGYLGDVYYSKATYVRRHGNPGGWFADKSRSGGGPVIDLGVHVIDFTRFMMGSPKPVCVFASVQSRLGGREHLKNKAFWIPEGVKPDDKSSVEDFGVALIRYDNGAVTMLETSYDINGDSVGGQQFFGTKAGLDLRNGVKLFSEYDDFLADIQLNIENSTMDVKDGFAEELNHFCDCVLNGTECSATAEDGIAVMKILDAIYESGRTGHEVLIQ